uniref:NADH-ubiquinone oxidoreductase chain 1 n=1 Tax=Brachionus fernandoi TaxID=2498032 RepID=A0A8K1I8E9_9BILA|nr:NADH dehydrogenase subunit 1 [Brachionus fernandoi]
MLVLCWLLHCLLLLLSVAFFTLFERKVMGLFHNRLGPNKVSFIGLLQPLLDAFKLLSKQSLTPLRSNKFTYNAAPHTALILALFVWLTMPTLYVMLSMNYSLIMFFCISSVMVFSVLLAGWSSNSKYSLIGSLRSVAQSISYEAVFSTLIVLVTVLLLSFSVRSSFVMSSLLYIPLLPLWIICTLAETPHALIGFEGIRIWVMLSIKCMLLSRRVGVYPFGLVFILSLGGKTQLNTLFFLFSWLIPTTIFFYVVLTLLFSFLFIWIRITFCRFRYDMLMMTSWKVLLPLVLMLFACYSPCFL